MFDKLSCLAATKVPALNAKILILFSSFSGLVYVSPVKHVFFLFRVSILYIFKDLYVIISLYVAFCSYSIPREIDIYVYIFF